MKLSRAHLAKEEEHESTQDEEEDNNELGPNAHISLLDQHSKLKQEAQGLENGSLSLFLSVCVCGGGGIPLYLLLL